MKLTKECPEEHSDGEEIFPKVDANRKLRVLAPRPVSKKSKERKGRADSTTGQATGPNGSACQVGSIMSLAHGYQRGCLPFRLAAHGCCKCVAFGTVINSMIIVPSGIKHYHIIDTKKVKMMK